MNKKPYFIFGKLTCINGNFKSVIPLSFVFKGLKKEDYEETYIEFSNRFFEDSNIQSIVFVATDCFGEDGFEKLEKDIVFDEIHVLPESW